MNEALQRWREDFARDPGDAFDRLVRGVVPLGGASQFSFGEILDATFEPADPVLDTAAADWLAKRILGPVPEKTTLHRWGFVLEEYFRGIAAMELPQTGGILRRHYKRLRLWLQGFYEGPDRDPEGAYLLALARAQDDQRFSPLWRRLILGEEQTGRPYLGIGILGFRKMPEQDGRESSGVPDGLLQALMKLGDKPGTSQTKWKQTMRSLFGTYRRSESYWVEHLAPLLPHDKEPSKAREWLAARLPRIREFSPPTADYPVSRRNAQPVPVPVSRDWAERVRQNPDLCDTPEFLHFLDQHRTYAQTTGDAEYINKTFNNLSTSIIRAEPGRAVLTVSLMEEALAWAPQNPHNWTSYAIVLNAGQRVRDAINALWEARDRFPWDPFIRSELGRLLRENGDLAASADVLREAIGQFPGNVVLPSGLAETLRAMERFQEARKVYEQTCKDFPNNAYCLRGLADLLIDLKELEEAERLYRESMRIAPRDEYARSGLARVLSIRSARTRDVSLRDEARRLLAELADAGNQDAIRRVQVFDGQWERATKDPTITFRRESGDQQPQEPPAPNDRAIQEMSAAERLGRAMIALWQAERGEDAGSRSSHCEHALALLDVPEDKTDDDLLTAFVETRGLVLLASGDAQKALAYFENQIRHYGRGGWIGLQLMGKRARTALGAPQEAGENAEAPCSQSTRFALHVAQVIQTLSASPPEAEVRKLLKTLYPEAAKLAARVQPDSEGGLSVQNGGEMLGVFLQMRWFRPAGIQSAGDLDRSDALQAVVERINTTRIDTFDVISNSTLALAA